ncbi:MAG: c-type cytochrome [Deltaproteobacteria bacterium]|nr:c-type cytochrome [Deltaproteobacteria bacterium]
MKAVLNVFIFLLLVLATFLYVGKAITDLTGGEKKGGGGAVEVTPEGGEAIFWGKGRCFTCHSLGDRGSAVRCPNLGQFGEKFALPIGARAVERAKERSEQTGKNYSPTDYLVESLADPGAFVVDGYKNEMAIVFAPPISLSLDEIKAVVVYLQSQGGDLDMDALNNPSEVTKKYYDKIAAASAAGGGDPGNGKIVFEDNCSECHMIGDEGGEIGPQLSAIGKKGLKYISESIVQPGTVIVEGFETHVVVNKEGRQFKGIKTRDEATEIDITKADGDVVTISKSDIKESKIDESTSVMPDDLSESLTVKDYQDVLSYLIMQKAQK